MLTMKKYLFSVAFIIVVLGCNNDSKYREASYNEAVVVSDSTAVDQNATPKIIKTADMRFRVKDVQQTKELLTSRIKSEGGVVTDFEINSIPQDTKKVKFTGDSLKEITSFRKEGTLVAKVPSEKLDDFTNEIVKLALFVDHQSLKMDDQSLNYLANQLKAQARKEAIQDTKRVKNTKGSNVNQSVDIKDAYIDKTIENRYIDDRVKFSTITLNFYQDNTIHQIVIVNDNLSDYGPGFFKRIGLNVLAGWLVLKEFILGLVTLWPFLILGVGLFYAIRYLIKTREKRQKLN